jgi:hypothetical protein
VKSNRRDHFGNTVSFCLASKEVDDRTYQQASYYGGKNSRPLTKEVQRTSCESKSENMKERDHFAKDNGAEPSPYADTHREKDEGNGCTLAIVAQTTP